MLKFLKKRQYAFRHVPNTSCAGRKTVAQIVRPNIGKSIGCASHSYSNVEPIPHAVQLVFNSDNVDGALLNMVNIGHILWREPLVKGKTHDSSENVLNSKRYGRKTNKGTKYQNSLAYEIPWLRHYPIYIRLSRDCFTHVGNIHQLIVLVICTVN